MLEGESIRDSGRCVPSACESCGGEFACGAKLAGCWCAEVKLSEEARAELRTRFGRCLCRPCLESYAAREHAAEQSVTEK